MNSQLLKRSLVAFLCLALTAGCSKKNNNNKTSPVPTEQGDNKKGGPENPADKDVVLVDEAGTDAYNEKQIEAGIAALEESQGAVAVAFKAFMEAPSDTTANVVAESALANEKLHPLAGMKEIKSWAKLKLAEISLAKDEAALAALKANLRILEVELTKEKKKQAYTSAAAQLGIAATIGVVGYFGPRAAIAGAYTRLARLSLEMRKVGYKRLSERKALLESKREQIAKYLKTTADNQAYYHPKLVGKNNLGILQTEGRENVKLFLIGALKESDFPGAQNAIANLRKVNKPSGIDRNFYTAHRSNHSSSNKGHFPISGNNQFQVVTNQQRGEVLVLRQFGEKKERWIIEGLSAHDVKAIASAVDPKAPGLRLVDEITGRAIVHEIPTALTPFASSGHARYAILKASGFEKSAAYIQAEKAIAQLGLDYSKAVQAVKSQKLIIQNYKNTGIFIATQNAGYAGALFYAITFASDELMNAASISNVDLDEGDVEKIEVGK